MQQETYILTVFVAHRSARRSHPFRVAYDQPILNSQVSSSYSLRLKLGICCIQDRQAQNGLLEKKRDKEMDKGRTLLIRKIKDVECPLVVHLLEWMRNQVVELPKRAGSEVVMVIVTTRFRFDAYTY